MPYRLIRCVACGLAIMTIGLGCTGRNAYVPPPPPEVVVASPRQRTITVYHEFPGTTQASDSVQVRARVQGYLESVHFEDGAMVTRGDLLFVIDPRPYRAQLDQARAALESKQASAIEASALYKRTLALIPSQAATREEADIQKGNMLVAKAAIAEADAKVRQALLNVEYTEVRAPLSGRISRRLVDVGNLVSTDATLLTTITRYDPMYAYFNATESQYLDYLQRLRDRPSGTLEGASPHSPGATAASAAGSSGTPGGPWGSIAGLMAIQSRYPVELGLANETGYPHKGVVDFANNTVDPTSGTLLLRGVFANAPPYFLVPGLFVRLRVPIRTQPNALLVPDRALGTDQSGPFLLIVRADDVAERRSLRVGSQEGNLRVIEAGLKADERFVLEGLTRARPGNKVQPVTATPGQAR
ncbi:MAG: efflux RND transporter periplasmic adaptor subunit [Gemmataceae bacterium]|nr:efflux RND transporter periplasmic adaptor subunit [Gemmataceae bacterium]